MSPEGKTASVLDIFHLVSFIKLNYFESIYMVTCSNNFLHFLGIPFYVLNLWFVHSLLDVGVVSVWGYCEFSFHEHFETRLCMGICFSFPQGIKSQTNRTHYSRAKNEWASCGRTQEWSQVARTEDSSTSWAFGGNTFDYKLFLFSFFFFMNSPFLLESSPESPASFDHSH